MLRLGRGRDEGEEGEGVEASIRSSGKRKGLFCQDN